MKRMNERGFTLLEAFFSMIIILIGMLAIFGLFETGLSNLATAKVRMHSALLATNFFEEIKTFDFDSLPGDNTVANLATTYPGRITDFPTPFEGDIVTEEISEDLDGNGSDDYEDKEGNSMLKQVTLTVRAPGVRFKQVTFYVRIAR